MKRCPQPMPGLTGPRRPVALPFAYSRVPVRDVREFPIPNQPPTADRLTVLGFTRTLAPGAVKGYKIRSYGSGSVCLSGYLLSVCVTLQGGEWWLETSAFAYDQWHGRHERLDLSREVLANIYRAVQKSLIGDEARVSRRGTERN